MCARHGGLMVIELDPGLVGPGLRSYGSHMLHVEQPNKILGNTVKPVLSGPVLNGHPLLSGQL